MGNARKDVPFTNVSAAGLLTGLAFGGLILTLLYVVVVRPADAAMAKRHALFREMNDSVRVTKAELLSLNSAPALPENCQKFGFISSRSNWVFRQGMQDTAMEDGDGSYIRDLYTNEYEGAAAKLVHAALSYQSICSPPQTSDEVARAFQQAVSHSQDVLQLQKRYNDSLRVLSLK